MNCQTTIFQHIGAARLYGGSMRIDIKTMQAVITRSDLVRLIEHSPVDIFDISDVVKAAGMAKPVGQAWITRSGRAIMYQINGQNYVSPLAQVKGILVGLRKYANVSVMSEISLLTSNPASTFPAKVSV